MVKIQEVGGIPIFREDHDENQDIPYDSLRKRFKNPNDMPVRVHGERVIASAGTFSDSEMLAAIALKHIVHTPFDLDALNRPKDMNPASLDVKVGYNFFATDVKSKEQGDRTGLYNQYDPDDIKRYFGSPLEATPLREQGELRRRLGIEALNNIDSEHPLMILRPGERILAHTHEFIGIYAPGMGNVQAKSSDGRSGLTVAQDATLLNPGWIGRLVLEIKNENEHEYLPLLVGTAVAQMTYHGTGPVRKDYASTGSYVTGGGIDLEEVISTWNPEQHMLPKPKSAVIPTPIPGLKIGIR